MNTENLTFAQEVIATWENNPAIREEFKTFRVYASYRMASAEGRVRIIGKAVIRKEHVEPAPNKVEKPREDKNEKQLEAFSTYAELSAD